MQSQLGYVFLEDSGLGKTATDSLSGKTWVLKEEQSKVPVKCSEVPSPKENSPLVTVRLVQTKRLPAHHGRLVTAQVTGSVPCGFTCTLLQPAEESLQKEGVVVESGATEPDSDGFLTFVVQNWSTEPSCPSY